MPAVLITLGSNIDKEVNLPQAIDVLRQHPEMQVIAVSPIYVTAPVGGAPGQSDFYNAAAWIETDLAPAALRERLRAIEARQGRVRTMDKYRARTIDLDIAFYGQETLTINGAPVPDPDIVHLAHLALPLADIAPNWRHPNYDLTLRQIADNLAYTQTEIRKV